MVEVSDALGSTCLSTEDDCSNKFDFFVSVIDDKVEAILRFSNSVEIFGIVSSVSTGSTRAWGMLLIVPVNASSCVLHSLYSKFCEKFCVMERNLLDCPSSM